MIQQRRDFLGLGAALTADTDGQDLRTEDNLGFGVGHI